MLNFLDLQEVINLLKMKYLAIIIVMISCGRKEGERKEGNLSEESRDLSVITEDTLEAKNTEESITQNTAQIVEDFSENEGIDFSLVSWAQVATLQEGKITLLNDQEAEFEPGDFRKIQIGDYELVNFGAWVKVYERFSDYSPNGYYLELDLGGQNTVIGFIGYPYASDPAYLTLISLGESPELIFNKQVNFKRVEGKQVIVVDGRGEEHKLYFEGDTLKYE